MGREDVYEKDGMRGDHDGHHDVFFDDSPCGSKKGRTGHPQ
jgi:hypothetical protein